jgi:hypothetical protein
MHIVLVVSLRSSHFSYFCPKFKKWCRGDRGRTSSVLIAHQWPVVATAIKVPDVDGAPQGATGIDVADVDPG